MGIVSAGWMWQNIRYAILGIFIIAAIISPTPDILNMCIFAAPMMALYVSEHRHCLARASHSTQETRGEKVVASRGQRRLTGETMKGITMKTRNLRKRFPPCSLVFPVVNAVVCLALAVHALCSVACIAWDQCPDLRLLCRRKSE